MNQKLLLELNQDLQKQPDPYCNLEEVAGLYHLTCLLDENIPNVEVPDDATPTDIEKILSSYLKDRNIERSESIDEVSIYPDLELQGADLEPLEYIDNQQAFDLLISLVSLYSSKSINTVYFTEHALDCREDWLEDEDDDDSELSQAVVTSAKEILKTKTALAINEYWEIPIIDQICSLRKELSLNKNEVPAFLITYISDALDTFEKCTGIRFNKIAGDDDYYENHSPLYYNSFYLYPEDPENIGSHDQLISDIDESINSDLQNHSGAVAVHREEYEDISFFMDAVKEFKEVVGNFNYITEALR